MFTWIQKFQIYGHYSAPGDFTAHYIIDSNISGNLVPRACACRQTAHFMGLQCSSGDTRIYYTGIKYQSWVRGKALETLYSRLLSGSSRQNGYCSLSKSLMPCNYEGQSVSNASYFFFSSEIRWLKKIAFGGIPQTFLSNPLQ